MALAKYLGGMTVSACSPTIEFGTSTISYVPRLFCVRPAYYMISLIDCFEGGMCCRLVYSSSRSSTGLSDIHKSSMHACGVYVCLGGRKAVNDAMSCAFSSC